MTSLVIVAGTSWTEGGSFWNSLPSEIVVAAVAGASAMTLLSWIFTQKFLLFLYFPYCFYCGLSGGVIASGRVLVWDKGFFGTRLVVHIVDVDLLVGTLGRLL